MMVAWKNAETEFKHQFEALGKRCWVYRFEDAAETFGRNNRQVTVSARPSDFLVTLDGQTFYAEVKSTAALSFSRHCMQVGQVNAAVRVTAAGGAYFLFVLHSITQKWYIFPWQEIASWTTKSKAFLKLEEFAHDSVLGHHGRSGDGRNGSSALADTTAGVRPV